MTTEAIRALVERLRNCRCVESTNVEDVAAYVRENYAIRHEAAAAIEALKPMADMVMVPRGLIQNIDKTGQNLLDAIMVRFPDLKEYPDLIHSTDIGKGLLEAIREFHLAWADLGADSILKMTDAEALAAAPPASPAPVDDGERADKLEEIRYIAINNLGSTKRGLALLKIVEIIDAMSADPALAAINGEE